MPSYIHPRVEAYIYIYLVELLLLLCITLCSIEKTFQPNLVEL